MCVCRLFGGASVEDVLGLLMLHFVQVAARYICPAGLARGSKESLLMWLRREANYWDGEVVVNRLVRVCEREREHGELAGLQRQG